MQSWTKLHYGNPDHEIIFIRLFIWIASTLRCIALASGHHWNQVPWRCWYWHCLCGWLKGLSRGNWSGLPQGFRWALYRSYGAHSLNFVGWKERKQVAEDLRRIYSAITIEKAEMELRQFEEKWGPIGTYRRRLVEELASLNDVHWLPAGHQKSNLYDRRDWLGHHGPALGDKRPRVISNWWSGVEIILSGVK